MSLRMPDGLSVDRVAIEAVTADTAQIVTHGSHEETPGGRAGNEDVNGYLPKMFEHLDP